MYFNEIRTLAELKSRYRKLAFELHPDRGGDAKEFSAMQMEYERRFAELKNAKGNQAGQTRYTYNGQGNQTGYSCNDQANRTNGANKERAEAGRRRKQESKHGYADDGFEEIIEILMHLSGIKVELCGQWLWISGNTKEHREALKAAGCKRSEKKKWWYWRPAESASRHNRNTRSMSYIRKKYGSVKIAEENETGGGRNRSPIGENG